jgi:uncharacterized protein (TIGR01319 family)
MSFNRATSILAVDFGNVHTRGVLIDQVDGAYALVAQAEDRTTAGFPIGDASVGLARVLARLSDATGRRLLRPDGGLIIPEQPDRSGVDLFLATASIGRPLRTVLIGLVPDLSVMSGLRAAAGTYVDISETITLDDDRTAQEQMNTIIMRRPELIFITGGTEKGASEAVLELAGIVRLASQLMPSAERPMILYAGNSALVPRIQELFANQKLFIADNVRPSLESESLESAQAQFAAAFDSASEGRITGFERVGSMSALGVLPTAQSSHVIADYLGRTVGNVLIADVGSAVSTISVSLSRGRSSNRNLFSRRARRDRHVTTSIRTDIGMGHSADSLVRAAGIEAVRAWLPFVADDNEIMTYAMNKTLRPYTIPETHRTLYLEHALLRAGLRAQLRDARPSWATDGSDNQLLMRDLPLPPFAQIIGAGATLTGTGRPGMTAMLLLDALQPTGVTELRIDAGGLIPALGALARANPQAAVQVIDAGAPERLGTVFNVSGTPREGRPAVKVRITTEGGTGETHTISGGELWIYPLPIDTQAEVRISVARGLHIGGKRRLRLKVTGGLAGIVIDARGRPLPLAATARERAAQIPAWYAQATGDGIQTIPDEWVVETYVDVEEKPVRRRRGRAAEEPSLDKRADEPKRGRRGRNAVPEPEPEESLDDLRNLLP